MPGSRFFPEFEVDTTDFDNHEANDVAIGQDGDFVVAWYESDTSEVLARAFSAITVPLGDPFPMNADTAPVRRRRRWLETRRVDTSSCG